MESQDRPDGSDTPAAEARRGRHGSADGTWRRQDVPPAEHLIDTQPHMISVTEVPEDDGDWMEQARREAEVDAWSPGGGLVDDVTSDAAAPSLVRPYARTGGRTKPVRDLDLEALVHTTVGGKEASTGPWLNPEHTTIIEMCSGTVSVAEIAVKLRVPIGVARVIIADMVDLGLVEVMQTSALAGDERDPAFLRRVLSGLQRL